MRMKDKINQSVILRDGTSIKRIDVKGVGLRTKSGTKNGAGRVTGTVRKDGKRIKVQQVNNLLGVWEQVA